MHQRKLNFATRYVCRVAFSLQVIKYIFDKSIILMLYAKSISFTVPLTKRHAMSEASLVKPKSRMQVVYVGQEFPSHFTKSIMLAGPTPREAHVPSWRPEAI